MALMSPSAPAFMTAQQAVQRRGHAARSELALRQALETFCRTRWPEARVVHEMVMGARQVRADVVAIGTDHIAAFEVKGSYDETTRLLHQVGMFQLCVPEVWMVVAENHEVDAKLIRHLMPSIGLLVAPGLDRGYRYDQNADAVEIKVDAESTPRPVAPEMMLEMMWADELQWMCGRLRVACGKRSTRSTMIKGLLKTCSVGELMAECCAALRGRDALWRADPPLKIGGIDV